MSFIDGDDTNDGKDGKIVVNIRSGIARVGWFVRGRRWWLMIGRGALKLFDGISAGYVDWMEMGEYGGISVCMIFDTGLLHLFNNSNPLLFQELIRFLV